jgi:predicted ATP-grasp superfamily ATP-dependent carboligase
MLPSLDAKYPALILKMSRAPIHHGALAVARTLGRLGVPVYAVAEDAYTPLAMSRHLTKAFVWDSCPTDPESFVNAMSLIAHFIARPTIIFPMDDLSAVSVAENAAILARWFIIPSVPPRLPRQLANKACFHALCAEIGIPLARSVVPRSLDDVRAFTDSTEFPVVVKATEQWLPLKDTFVTKVIQTPEQLLDLCENYNYEGSQRLIIQEHIPGEDWICHGYYNFDKNINVTFTGIKLRSYPPDAGSTALGLSLDNETLRCVSEKLLKAVAYSGIIDMDWRKDERDGQYKILDCNPRVGQNFRMFENRAGIDVVRAQHLDLSGRRIDNAAPIGGRLFRVESFYALAFLRRLPRGASKQDTGKYLPSESRELAWWSSDDPVPFLMMSIRQFTRVLGRLLGFLRFSPLRSRLARLCSRTTIAANT